MMGFREKVRTKRPTVEEIEKLETELGRAPTVGEIRALYKTEEHTRFEAYTPSQRLEDDEDVRLVEALQQAIKDAAAA